jgi:hypothetical protein
MKTQTAVHLNQVMAIHLVPTIPGGTSYPGNPIATGADGSRMQNEVGFRAVFTYTVPTKKPKSTRRGQKHVSGASIERTRQGAEWYIDRGVGATPREACSCSAGTRFVAGV